MDRGIPDAGLSILVVDARALSVDSAGARAGTLASELGLRCAGVSVGLTTVALSLPADGSFGCQRSETSEVPDKSCQGQWLRLTNPVSGGAGQRVAGELWLANMQIERLAN
ncbi:MAG: hypothetical protein U1F19_04005 [Lysobacterales bacterium]